MKPHKHKQNGRDSSRKKRRSSAKWVGGPESSRVDPQHHHGMAARVRSIQQTAIRHRRRLTAKLYIPSIVAVLLLVAFVFALWQPAAPAASHCPEGTGELLIHSGDHEFTLVVKNSLDKNNWPSHPWIGYNLHRYSNLSLCLIPGELEGFDYWCGDTKYFFGGIEIVAGETTERMLMPTLCENETEYDPGPTPTSQPTATPQPTAIPTPLE